MNDPRSSGTQTARDAARQDQDFQALRSATARDPRTLDHTVRSARERRPRTWEEWLMSTMRTTKRRPWIGAALAGGLAALALLVIPISYEKTTGHDVKLTLTGPGLLVDYAGEIARQLKSALGAPNVTMAVEGDDQSETYTLEASVPARKGTNTPAVAQAFAAGLTKLGYTATAATTPRKERVSGNVYAFARDRVIQVSLDGKSAGQIESEIRQRFAEAGITGTEVSVTQDAAGKQLGVKIKAEHIQKAGDPPLTEQEIPQLVLTKNGAPVTGGKGLEVQMKKMKSAAGETLVIDVTQDGKTAQAQVPGADTMSDAALAAAIQRQLERAGLSVTVKVTNGGVEITPKP